MKKILSICLCLFALFLVVGCSKEEKEYDLSQIVFEDATYDYDGKAHSIYVQNLPEGLQVEYEGNSQTEVGSYTIKATIKYSSGEKLTTLTAKMTIRVGFDLSDVTFVDKTFEYDGKAHSIEVENLPDGITVEYKNNGQTNPGRYVVKATLLDENGNVVKYLAARIIITGDGVNIPSEGGNEDQPSNGGSSIDVSGVVFENKEVEYDGELHKVECENVPEGVIVTYLMNAQTEPGKYDAVAVLTDAETLEELTRLFATLTITGEGSGSGSGDDSGSTSGDSITIILDITWENISEAWCNDTQMTLNDLGLYEVTFAETYIGAFKLDFCQNSQWFHITYQNPSEEDKWNTSYMLPYDMTGGHTYKVTNITWSHQWDNEENKWYTATIIEE